MLSGPLSIETADMPFAEMTSRIAFGLERLGNCDFFLRKMSFIGGLSPTMFSKAI